MKDIVKKLREIYHKLGCEWSNSFLLWEIPEKIKADFSLNVFRIASWRKESLEEITKKISIELTKDSFLKKMLLFEIYKGGFINFSFSFFYYQNFGESFLQKKNNQLKEIKKEKETINIEFISANPTGYLHLAHLRQGFLGQTLANIYKHLGFKVVKEYYINDTGKQIDDLINSVIYYYDQERAKNEEKIPISYPGEFSEKAAHWLKKKKITLVSPKKIFKKQILIFAINQIKKDLKKCNIFFNRWTSEQKNIQKKSLLIEKSLLNWKKRGLTYEKDGAIFLKKNDNNQNLNDEKDRVLIKSNKEWTYLFKDIFFHQEKSNRSDKLINIWGSDHHGYAKSLTEACELLIPDIKKKITIIFANTIHLSLNEKRVKFSKRAGNVILLKDALKCLSIDQLKFFCLEKDFNSQIVINKEILKKSQKTGLSTYIQYAFVRCLSLLRKAPKKNSSLFVADFNQEEREILNKIIRLDFILEETIKEKRPHLLLYHFLDITKKWQAYYQNNQIINKKDLIKTKKRLLLTKIVKNILKTGLKLLGLNVPKKI